MGRFFPLYIARSDGMLETATKHGARNAKEANKPTPKQLDDKPKSDGVKDYYREVAIDESKHMDWRRKLAAMLARDLNLDLEKGYILAHFPENYRLFEHVKTAKKGEGEPKTKTHAGGGNERQDAYLYGHPLGRKKRFRSPGDFYPHLLWLATDPEGDSDNCGCKICCPEEMDASMRDQTVQPVIARRPSTQTRPSNTPTPGPQAAASVVPPSRIAATPVQQQPPPAAATQPAPRPVAKPMDYEIDRQYGLFLFRQGEMVWFDKSGAWGLGVITERSKVGNDSNYRVQPLSYPEHYTQSVNITRDVDLRPWLAWSVPPYTHDALNKINHSLHYSTFDFKALATGKFGEGTVEIDASIMAAKAIDATYTPFNPESRSETQSYIEVRWSGIYLGAEKIWLNEPVRLVLPMGQAATRVLVVRAIVERTQKSARQTYSAISFIGDVYIMLPVESVTMDRAPNGLVAGSDTVNVPLRMLEDIRRRNIYTIQAKGTAFYWKLLERNKAVDMKDVRGRWYESTLFLPILLPKQAEDYERQARQGVITEVLGMMNGHGDCNNDKEGRRLIPDARASHREQAFGKAVPERIVVVEGVKAAAPALAPQQVRGQVTSNYQGGNGHAVPGVAGVGNGAGASTPATNHTQQQQQQQQQQMTGDQTTGFEEFMDLDGLGGDVMGGFDQAY
ncbi:hypothetical protein E4T47_00783 [Aureobasidium subglaciale]|nr:hypothetical protein E4T47_00783 [Aureobasidium subglaciale]